MGRAIGGAVLGYIVMFVIVFCGLTLAWMLLGADGAFERDGHAVHLEPEIVVIGAGRVLVNHETIARPLAQTANRLRGPREIPLGAVCGEVPLGHAAPNPSTALGAICQG